MLLSIMMNLFLLIFFFEYELHGCPPKWLYAGLALCGTLIGGIQPTTFSNFEQMTHDTHSNKQGTRNQTHPLAQHST